jgi:hypothetical protein
LTRACISSSPPFLPKSRAFHDTVPTQVNSFWETFADLTPSLWRTQQVCGLLGRADHPDRSVLLGGC